MDSGTTVPVTKMIRGRTLPPSHADVYILNDDGAVGQPTQEAVDEDGFLRPIPVH